MFQAQHRQHDFLCFWTGQTNNANSTASRGSGYRHDGVVEVHGEIVPGGDFSFGGQRKMTLDGPPQA
jgi:hypothetical protein